MVEGNDVGATMESRLVQRLRCLYAESSAIRATIDWFAAEAIHALETVESTVMTAAGVSAPEARSVLRDLANAGAGRYFPPLGRRPGRLRWHHDTLEIALAAIGSTDTEPTTRVFTSFQGDDLPFAIPHEFELRPDFRVRIDLPEDFGIEDADRLARHLRGIAEAAIDRNQGNHG